MFLLLMLFWLILNGKWTLEILLTGAVLSAALCWVSAKLCGWSPRRELRALGLLPRVVAYFFLLFWNVVLSNLLVIREVLRPRVHIAPSIVTMRTPLHHGLERFVLANSITLTPGTVTVALHGGRLCVYALDQEFAAGIKDSEFVRRLRRWEGKQDG